jgi:hypothetical protein
MGGRFFFYYRHRGVMCYCYTDDNDNYIPSCVWWIIPGLAEMDAAAEDRANHEWKRMKGEKLCA